MYKGGSYGSPTVKLKSEHSSKSDSKPRKISFKIVLILDGLVQTGLAYGSGT